MRFNILMSLTVLGLMLALFHSGHLYAQENTEQPDPVETSSGEDLGWHYYSDEVEEPEEEKPLLTPPVAAQPAAPTTKPFSIEWFQENFDRVHQQAVDNPTKENIRALLYLERVMADKSEVFARRKQFFQSTDPLLQEGTRIPMMGAAKNALMIYKKEQREAAIDELRNHVGFVFFYDESCQWCHKMVPIINYMKITTGADIRVFAKNSIDGQIPLLDESIPVFPDAGLSNEIGITVWPALVMLRPPQDAYIVSQGSLTYEEMTTRLINIAFDQNILNEEWYYRVYPEQQGLIATDQVNGIEHLNIDDPVELINTVIDMVRAPEGNNPTGSSLEQVESHEF